MATITTTIDTARQLTVQTVKGPVTGGELAGPIRSYYAGQPTRLILWDFTGADMTSITPPEVSNLVALTQRFSSLREGGRTAMVAPSDLGFGLGRMFDIQREGDRSNIDHMTFRSTEQAFHWLLEE